jgi:hypothetical protein
MLRLVTWLTSPYVTRYGNVFMNRWMHVTSFYLNWNWENWTQVRGERLKDNVEIVALKPCHVSIVQGNLLTNSIQLSLVYTITYIWSLTILLLFFRGVQHRRGGGDAYSETFRHHGMHLSLQWLPKTQSSQGSEFGLGWWCLHVSSAKTWTILWLLFIFPPYTSLSMSV